MPPKATPSKIDKKAEKQREASGFFTLPNGDMYDGGFMANKATKTVVRQGVGTYRTWDGQQYIGTWENDVLAKGEPVRIEFADCSVYTGLVSNQMDYLGGTYQFHDGSQIKCAAFGKANVPTEADGLEFADPSGAIWDRAMVDQLLIVRHAPKFYHANDCGGGDDDRK